MDGTRQNWIATWGTAQQLAVPAGTGAQPRMPEPDEPPAVPTTIDRQTVRMVARATVGGTAVRVTLSNSFGLAPVRIDAVRVARHDRGAAIVPAGARTLTFGGRPAVTLPTGAHITSDPIGYDVPPQADLVVSLYVADRSVTPTRHEVGLRAAWLAPGDQTAGRYLRDATPFRSYLWLTGVDVLAEPAAATIVAFGDSVVDGLETTPDADAPWPSVLARRLAARPDLPPRAVINMGIAGNRLLRESEGLGAAALARFDRDVLARPGVRWVVLSEGLNDMFFGAMPGMPDSERATAADIIAGCRMLIARARLSGIRLIGCTLIPVGGAVFLTPELEQTRREVNGWIRDGGEFDAVVDLEAAVRDPADPGQVRAGLLSGDGVHPNDAGHAVIADAFDLDLFRD